MKIMVVGIGGVGGYLSGILCAHHPAEVTLVARGKRREALQRNGLVIHSDFCGEHVHHPQVVEKASDAGEQDVIFVCVKNYSWDTVMPSLQEVVKDHTIIVPVLNGVDHEQEVRRFFPHARVVSSSIYITSSYNEDYSIKQSGQYARIFLGSKDDTALESIYQLLHQEGFTCQKTDDIQAEEWKKYVMNCAYNVLTAYYEGTVEEVFARPEGKEEFKALLTESYQVGKALGVNLPNDLVEVTYQRVLNQQDKNVTSSFARDVMAHRPNELETFSGYVVKKAQALNIPAPLSTRIYAELKERLG